MSALQKSRRFLNGIYSKHAAQQLDRLIREARPDIAHVHNILFQLTPSIFPVLRRHNLPIVQSLHDWHMICGASTLYTKGGTCERCKGGHYYRCALHACYRGSTLASLMASLGKYLDRSLDLWRGNVDVFGVPSQHMVDRYAAWGFDPERFVIVPNPFDYQRFPPSSVVGDHVVWYGRMDRHKGIYTILEAARLLPNVRFELYGTGLEEAEVRAVLAERRMENVMLDTTTRWGDVLQERISTALCVVEPSEWYQPSPYVIWESFALGKAVLATNIGGARDLIRHDVNGGLFPPRDSGTLAELIRQLSDNKDAARRWGGAARAWLEETLGNDGFYRRLLEMFDQAFRAHEMRTNRPTRRPEQLQTNR